MLYKTTTEKQTMRLGEKLAKKLKGGEVVLLSGNLGSGKTVFVKGIAQGLGVKKTITSPTFVLFKVYKVNSKKTPVKFLVHADCYRLASFKDIKNIGLDEYFADQSAVTVIEWGEKIKGTKSKVIVVKFNYSKNKKGRVVEVKL